MKFYMLFHTPSGGFYKAFGANFRDVYFGGVTNAKRLSRNELRNLIESLVFNKENGIDAKDLEVYEFTGKKI